MNHRQWEALKAATQGHAPGPWRMCWDDSQIRDGAGYCVSTNEAHNAKLAAAAPDLLAEVERLRGWLDFIGENPRGGHVTYVHAQNAVEGEEVPK